MQLLPRLPVTGRGTSLHQLTHYQVINLDSCWTCPAWLPRKWLHFKSKLTCAHCSGLPLRVLNWKHLVISYFYIYSTICIHHYWYRLPHSIQCNRSLKWCRARGSKQSGTRLRLGGSADKAILAAWMKMPQSNERSSWKGLLYSYPVFARVDFVIIYKLAGARSPSVCFRRLEKSYNNKFCMSLIFCIYKIPLGFCLFGGCSRL